MMQETKIAGNRIGVLIGKAGATKRDLEERTPRPSPSTAVRGW